MAKRTNARPGVPMRYSRDGLTRMSDDDAVIALEQRGQITKPLLHVNLSGDEQEISAKPFDIPKRLLWDAWKHVRANRGSAGIDEVSLDVFERNLGKNLYKL
jgi:hypothetical protein